MKIEKMMRSVVAVDAARSWESMLSVRTEICKQAIHQELKASASPKVTKTVLVQQARKLRKGDETEVTRLGTGPCEQMRRRLRRLIVIPFNRNPNSVQGGSIRILFLIVAYTCRSLKLRNDISNCDTIKFPHELFSGLMIANRFFELACWSRLRLGSKRGWGISVPGEDGCNFLISVIGEGWFGCIFSRGVRDFVPRADKAASLCS